MKIKLKYHFSEALFTKIYRTHCHIKFHIRRSMIMSILLLLFGLIMEKGYGKDYGWLNSVVIVLVIISVVCNYLCDYRIPKIAYRELCEQHQDDNVITLQEDGLLFGEGRDSVHRSWEQYDQCFETADAFLLYQKNLFTILLKDACGSQVDEVRDLLVNKVNKGKKIAFKK